MNTIILITGSRSINELSYIHDKLDSLDTQHSIVGIIEGEAQGVDQISAKWASLRNKTIYPFPVSEQDWENNPYGAGHERNTCMLDFASKMETQGYHIIGVAFWDGKSGGTRDMINKMRKKGITPLIFNPNSPFRR